MNKSLLVLAISISTLSLTGCETTNSIPYKASTENIISIQNDLKKSGQKVSVGNVVMAEGMDESLTCRLLGPVRVAPGKSLPEYIEDAFIEELFAAQVYNVNSETVINAVVDEIEFSSIAPASWDIKMTMHSNRSAGYTVAIHYEFGTSWSAYSACKNVADAFGPAVQELLHEVVTNPGFVGLAGG